MVSEADIALGEELQFHRDLARPGIVVDVGAHSGTFAFGMCDLSGITVVAIEPLPDEAETMRARVRESSSPVTIVEMAASDWQGAARLHIPVLAHGGAVRQWASISKDFDALRGAHPEILGTDAVEVRVATIDSLGLAGVTAMKVDCEGAEYEALRGARELLAIQQPILSVELEERHRAGCTTTVPPYLASLGYECFFQHEGRFRPFAEFDPTTMQRGSASPAVRVYSDPYISCFYFLPRSLPEMFGRIRVAGPGWTAIVSG